MGDQQPSSSNKSKEDREVDAALQAALSKVRGVKGTLSSFVGKMEQGPVTWPSVLDSFSATVSQFSTLMKQLSADKTPPLSNRVIIPLQVCSERDPDLERVTENRVSMLHHEIVPNYLRTKLDLELEAKHSSLAAEAAAKDQSLREEITAHNNIITSCLKIVSEAREDIEDQKSRSGIFQTTTSNETRKLVAAYLNGVGLPPLSNQRSRAILMGTLRMPKQPSAGGGKVQSAVKVEMREGISSASNPYSLTKKRTQ